MSNSLNNLGQEYLYQFSFHLATEYFEEDNKSFGDDYHSFSFLRLCHFLTGNISNALYESQKSNKQNKESNLSLAVQTMIKLITDRRTKKLKDIPNNQLWLLFIKEIDNNAQLKKDLESDIDMIWVFYTRMGLGTWIPSYDTSDDESSWDEIWVEYAIPFLPQTAHLYAKRAYIKLRTILLEHQDLLNFDFSKLAPGESVYRFDPDYEEFVDLNKVKIPPYKYYIEGDRIIDVPTRLQNDVKQQLEKIQSGCIDNKIALNINPLEPLAHFIRGSLWFYEDEYDIAIEELNTAINNGYCNDYISYKLRGLAFLYLKKIEQAVLDISKCIDLLNESSDLYYRLDVSSLLKLRSDVYFRNNQYCEYLEDCCRYQYLNPGKYTQYFCDAYYQNTSPFEFRYAYLDIYSNKHLPIISKKIREEELFIQYVPCIIRWDKMGTRINSTNRLMIEPEFGYALLIITDCSVHICIPEDRSEDLQGLIKFCEYFYIEYPASGLDDDLTSNSLLIKGEKFWSIYYKDISNLDTPTDEAETMIIQTEQDRWKIYFFAHEHDKVMHTAIKSGMLEHFRYLRTTLPNRIYRHNL